MDRFNEAVKANAKLEESTEEFFKSVLDLAKEISEKGIAGAELTDCEKKFTKASAIFLLHGLIAQKRNGVTAQ